MAKKLILAVILLIGMGLVSLFPGDNVGAISYLEGDAEITRDGDYYDDLDFGYPIENFDMVETYSDGLVEIKISASGYSSSILTVYPDSSLYIELTKIGSKKTTSVEMFAGSLSCKVAGVMGSQDYRIRTESTVMGIRGTEFNVNQSAAGDVLITCKQGEVGCTDESSGKTLSAKPGTAVEKSADGLFKSIPIAVSKLKTFKKDWMAEKISALKANALRAIKNYAIRYDKLYDSFNKDFRNLAKETDVILKWFQEDEKGITGSRAAQMQEKKKIIGHLLKLRGTLFIFEKVYFRLVELKSYYDEGYGRGTIAPGVSSAAFFKKFEEQQTKLKKNMATIKYVSKLYAKRNDGTVPTDAFSGDDGDDFFDGGDDFFDGDDF